MAIRKIWSFKDPLRNTALEHRVILQIILSQKKEKRTVQDKESIATGFCFLCKVFQNVICSVRLSQWSGGVEFGNKCYEMCYRAPWPERPGKHAWSLRGHWRSDPCIVVLPIKMPRKTSRNRRNVSGVNIICEHLGNNKTIRTHKLDVWMLTLVHNKLIKKGEFLDYFKHAYMNILHTMISGGCSSVLFY